MLATQNLEQKTMTKKLGDEESQGKTIEERIEKATSPSEPEAMPTSNEQEEALEVEVSDKETSVSDKETSTDEELTLPEGASERTREQFEKLKARLRKEREEKQRLLEQSGFQTPQNVFESFHPQGYQPPVGDYGYLTPQQVGDITNQFVDAEGNVDVAGLNAALQQANQAALEAINRAKVAEERIARFEETQQAKEAHAVFPELDPLNREKFDPTFFDLVRDRLLRNMYEGKSQTLLEAAQEIRKTYTPPSRIEEAKKEAIGEYQKAQAARNQGPIEKGSGEGRQTEGNLEELRRRTRQGDESALEERLRDLGIV